MRRRAFTLIEVLVATVLVGSAMVAAVYASANASKSIRISGERTTAQLLLNDLASEIMTLPFSDPEGGSGLGTDAGETDRASFDDVDDFRGFSESGPSDWSGRAIDSAEGWKRVVAVDMIASDGRTASDSSDTGLKRIGIRTLTPRGALYEIMFIRAQGGIADHMPPENQTLLRAVRAQWSTTGTRTHSTSTPLLNIPRGP